MGERILLFWDKNNLHEPGCTLFLVINYIKRVRIVLFHVEKHITYEQIVLFVVVEGLKLTLCMVFCDKMIHCVTCPLNVHCHIERSVISLSLLYEQIPHIRSE